MGCSRMYAKERRMQILDLLERDGRVGVSELAEAFDVTTETVRRDLDALGGTQLLTRVHGGAIAKRTGQVEPDLATRLSTNTAAKRRVAAAAARFLPTAADTTILLDAGSTTVELVPHLDGRGLRVVTNGLPIAEALVQVDVPAVQMLPGIVRGVTRAATGVDTVKALARLHPDVAFIGCNGFGPEGFTTPDPDEAAAKSAMVAQAGRRIVIADSSKAGERCFVTFASLEEVDVLVTDAGLSEANVRLIEQAGIEVVRA